MKIGIDMDNTICSTNEKILEYQNKYIKKEKISQEILWNIQENKEKFLKKNLEKIYNNAELKDNADLTINKLKECGYKIYIITKDNPFVGYQYYNTLLFSSL